MTIFSRSFSKAPTLAVLCAALSACSSGGTTLQPVTPAPPPVVPAGKMTFLPHQGLEIMAGAFGAQRSNIIAAPTGSLTTNATAFNLTAGFDLAYTGLVVAGAVTYAAGASATTRTFDGCNNCLSINRDTVTTQFTGGAASALTYTTYGAWEVRAQTGQFDQGNGVFATGLPTTTAERPVTGTATYNGGASGFISLATGDKYAFTGKVALNTNFAANTITGAVTAVTTTQFRTAGIYMPSGVIGTSNDIQLTAGTLSGTAFAGTAAAAAPGATAPSVAITGTTGTFGGIFYGPNAAEAGGSLALTSPTASVIAAFGAAK